MNNNLNGIDMSKVHKLVIENVEKRDIEALKSNISVVINFDKNFSKGYLKENLEYIKRCQINLYESLDESRPLLSNKSEYTDDDFSKSVFHLRKNFCKERLMDVQKIGETLYKEKVTKAEPKLKQQVQTNNKKTSYSSQNTQNKKKQQHLAIAIGIGVIAAGIIAFALWKS